MAHLDVQAARHRKIVLFYAILFRPQSKRLPCYCYRCCNS